MTKLPAAEPVLTCIVPADVSEIVSVLLFETGALAVGEEAAGADVALRAGFATEADAEAARAAIADWTEATVELVVPTWQDEQRVGFEPLRVGPWFISVPEEPTPAPAGATHLRIDPGRAFGHGAHPTTRLLLDLLPEAVGPDVRVLDVGTGTGILAIAAASLGAHACGLDIDAEAVACAEANIARNTLGERVQVLHSDGAIGFDQRVDVALVNVTIDQHRRIAQQLTNVPTVLISGLLDHQLDEAVELYERKLVDRRADLGWQAARLERETG